MLESHLWLGDASSAILLINNALPEEIIENWPSDLNFFF